MIGMPALEMPGLGLNFDQKSITFSNGQVISYRGPQCCACKAKEVHVDSTDFRKINLVTPKHKSVLLPSEELALEIPVNTLREGQPILLQQANLSCVGKTIGRFGGPLETCFFEHSKTSRLISRWRLDMSKIFCYLPVPWNFVKQNIIVFKQ